MNLGLLCLLGAVQAARPLLYVSQGLVPQFGGNRLPKSLVPAGSSSSSSSSSSRSFGRAKAVKKFIRKPTYWRIESSAHRHPVFGFVSPFDHDAKRKSAEKAHPSWRSVVKAAFGEAPTALTCPPAQRTTPSPGAKPPRKKTPPQTTRPHHASFSSAQLSRFICGNMSFTVPTEMVLYTSCCGSTPYNVRLMECNENEELIGGRSSFELFLSSSAATLPSTTRSYSTTPPSAVAIESLKASMANELFDRILSQPGAAELKNAAILAEIKRRLEQVDEHYLSQRHQEQRFDQAGLDEMTRRIRLRSRHQADPDAAVIVVQCGDNVSVVEASPLSYYICCGDALALSSINCQRPVSRPKLISMVKQSADADDPTVGPSLRPAAYGSAKQPYAGEFQVCGMGTDGVVYDAGEQFCCGHQLYPLLQGRQICCSGSYLATTEAIGTLKCCGSSVPYDSGIHDCAHNSYIVFKH